MWLGGLHIVHIRIVMCLMLNSCNWIENSGLQGYLVVPSYLEVSLSLNKQGS